MLSKCANPSCKARFRSLREGKLFHFQVASSERGHSSLRLVGGKKGPQSIEHYWLCTQCSGLMTLMQNRSEVVIVPLSVATSAHARRATAS